MQKCESCLHEWTLLQGNLFGGYATPTKCVAFWRWFWTVTEIDKRQSNQQKWKIYWKKSPTVGCEGTEKVDYTVYIWYNVSIKYRRCFYDRTTAEIGAKSIHGNIWIIAILQNTASNPIHQSVKYCVRNLSRASACLQISSLFSHSAKSLWLHYFIELL